MAIFAARYAVVVVVANPCDYSPDQPSDALPSDLASAHALADGIIAWREGRHSLESLLEEAATPSGIAAATTTKMDAAGYGRAVRQGVAAGLQRARANAGK